MKRCSLLCIICACVGLAVCFSSCHKEEAITESFFVGSWNVVKTEHLYQYESGDTLVSHTITPHELVYDFAKEGTMTITYDGDLIFRSEWTYKNGVLSMPVLQDDYVLFSQSGVWYVTDVSSSSFTAKSEGSVQRYNNEGEKIQYNERYTYYLEKK